MTKTETAKVVWKALKSTDPRKKPATAALRAAAGIVGGRVTNVDISKDGLRVRGDVLAPGTGKDQRGLEADLPHVTPATPAVSRDAIVGDATHYLDLPHAQTRLFRLTVCGRCTEGMVQGSRWRDLRIDPEVLAERVAAGKLRRVGTLPRSEMQDSGFCTTCAVAIATPGEPVTLEKCGECGKPLPAGASECPACQAVTDDNVIELGAPEPAEVAWENSPEEEQMAKKAREAAQAAKEKAEAKAAVAQAKKPRVQSATAKAAEDTAKAGMPGATSATGRKLTRKWIEKASLSEAVALAEAFEKVAKGDRAGAVKVLESAGLA